MRNQAGGSKGFVFSLDAALALLLVLGTFFAANFFVFEAQTEGWSRLSIKRQAEDIMFLLDRTQTLQSLDSETVQNFVDDILTNNLQMHIDIQTFSFQDNNFVLDTVVSVGPDPPGDRDVIEGRRLFLIFDDVNLVVSRYGNAEYEVWLK